MLERYGKAYASALPVKSARRIAAAALVAMLVPDVAWACRCVPLSDAQRARTSDAVVIADLMDVQDDGRGPRRFRFAVVESWKRRLPASIEITSWRTSCMAGIPARGRYLLYLHDRAGGLDMSRCSGTLPIAKAGGAVAALRRRYR